MGRKFKRRVTIREAADLRSVAAPAFESTLKPLPPGVRSLYGSEFPFGSAEFARREARELAPRSFKVPPEAIPGLRVSGSLWRSERFILRIPKRWNGRLVVAGTPQQRTEFACDIVFSDPLIARGFAYISGNKGNGEGLAILAADATLEIRHVRLPRLFIPGQDGGSVVSWQHGPGHTMERWLEEMLAMTEVAHEVLADRCGRAPELTYAIGLGNGGYEVRRAIESSGAFAGALTWNATMWRPDSNALMVLPEAIGALLADEPHRIFQMGFPPDVRSASGKDSLYRKNLFVHWFASLWLHAVHLDPEMSTAYGDVDDPTPAEEWAPKLTQWRYNRSPVIAQRVAGFSNTGDIRCKLVELASEFNHLITPKGNLDTYAKLVESAGKSALYRSEIIRNTQHVDAWSEDPEYSAMVPALPRVLRAWEDLIEWVEG